MAIQVKCGKCGQSFILPEVPSDGRFQCPACKAVGRIHLKQPPKEEARPQPAAPAQAAAPSEELAVEKPEEPPVGEAVVPPAEGAGRPPWLNAALDALRLAWPALVAVAGGVGFAFTLGSPPSSLVLLNYACLVACCVGATTLAVFRWRAYELQIKAAGVALTLAIALLYACFDTYRVQWTTEEGDRYTDTHRRFNEAQVRREIILKTGGTRSGIAVRIYRPHGPWGGLRPSGDAWTGFLWYGEQVTQKEWLLRELARQQGQPTPPPAGLAP